MFKKIAVLLVLAVFLLLETHQVRYGSFEKSVTIPVEIKGEVSKEGVYHVPREATLADLLELCGITADADLSDLALNRTLSYKEVIVIPRKPEEERPISINAATLEELMRLPGVGESTARKILEYREQHHGFHSLEELKEVSGIGEAKYAKILPYISL
ncbi:MAG: ComEA family DNA-binding protein [Erysipelotrichaceae bacterium]|nr:ComEA family DNA-binding protein [Erysipelotrichaceae bacterium]